MNEHDLTPLLLTPDEATAKQDNHYFGIMELPKQ